MFKISKPESFMLPSPSREDVRAAFKKGAQADYYVGLGWKAERCRMHPADPRAREWIL